MAIATTISRDMIEQLPPCFEPLMKDAVDMIKSLSIGKGFWEKNYKPMGMVSGFSMRVDIEDPVKIFAGHSNEYLGKVAQTLFTNEDLKPGISGLHQFWQENGKACESLSFSGSTEILIDCYEGPFEGRLLSQVCNVHPSRFERVLSTLGISSDYKALSDGPRYQTFNFGSADTNISHMPSVAQAIGGVVGAVGLYKAVQELRARNKVRALGWAIISVAAFVLPNVKLA